MRKRVIVIGGGASGLAAAVTAAEHGAAVTILERLPRVGKKILLTGNGRCNLGHSGYEVQHYHGSIANAETILRRLDTELWFRLMGLYCRTDAEGRRYPMSGTAASVLDALRMRAAALGVEECCDCKVTGLAAYPGLWQVQCEQAQFTADAVILAAGGSAAPHCGTDGNFLPMLQALGHRIVKPQPSLCPILTDPIRVRAMKGLRVHAAASAYVGSRILKTERGEVQFTDTALSGICIFNLSRLAAEHGKAMTISLNLLPDWTPEQVLAVLRELRDVRADAPLADLLTGLFPKRIGECVLKAAFGTAQGKSSECLHTDTALQALAQTLTDWQFPVQGRAIFAQAQVTAGGISGESVTPLLESKVCPRLYFCGELLDLDGDCGGYNLDWAWSSGVWAGFHAAQDGMRRSGYVPNTGKAYKKQR